MVEKLDKEKISQLMQEADNKWFNQHPHPGWNYSEHLDFVAAYVVRNYNGRGKR